MKGHIFLYGKRLGVLFLLALLISSCASFNGKGPDIVSEKKHGKFSNAYVREITIDQPFLISGDYFRERPLPKNTLDLGSFFKKNKNLEKRVAELEKKVENKELVNPGNTLYPKVPSVPKKTPGTLKNKFGILFLTPCTLLKDTMSNRFQILQRDTNFLFYSDAQLREILLPSGCLKTNNKKCIIRNLALYPGIRFLLLVKAKKDIVSFPSDLELNIHIIDTGLLYEYPSIRLRSHIKNKKEYNMFLDKVIGGVMELLKTKTSIMGWYARIFSSKGDKYYLNAGMLSGLKTGQILRVVEYQTPILAPTGVPVAWSPGPVLGKLRVTRLLGEDIAQCVPLDKNKKFKIGDLVVK